MTDPRHGLGSRAERAAARHLESSGWEILARRWRGSGGELDLVCRDRRGELVGVEVKVRSTGRAGSGAESVHARRLVRLRRTLVEFSACSGHRGGVRLDLITLEPAGGQRWRLVRLAAVDRL